MKILLVVLVVFIFEPTFGQSEIDSLFQTDSLNWVYFQRLKSEGKLDGNGLKTGYWIEYSLLTDSVDNVFPVTLQAKDTSFAVSLNFPKSTALQKAEGNYEDGIMTGRWKWFNALYYFKDEVIWEVKRETEFLDGKKNGKDREFSFGKVYHETTYLNDQLDGIELIYLFDDNLYLKGFYKNGLRQNAMWYYKDGGIKMSKDFKKDPLIKVVEYHENGKIKSKYNEYGDEKILQGEYRMYDQEGKLIKRIQYKDGVDVKK